MKINWTRLILGGLLAGLIVNVFELLVNGLILGRLWDDAIKSLNRVPAAGFGVAVFWLWGFLIGIFALWLYVTIRPRYGPGPKTAAIAGFAVWIPASLLAMMVPVALHLFRYLLIACAIALALVELVAGTIAGAWLYKEPDAPSAGAAPRAAV
jgi:hypothetical protein